MTRAISILFILTSILLAQSNQTNNYSLSYDGGDYLYKAIANYRGSDSQGAISVWVKPINFGSVKTYLASADQATGNYRFGGYQSQTNGFPYTDWAQLSATRDVVISDVAVIVNVWQNVIFQSTGTAIEIYINGVSQELSIAAGANDGDYFDGVTNRDNVTIGVNYASTLANYFLGSIDEVAVFSQALTPTQIAQIYNGGTPTDISGLANLVDYWRFEEGTGITTAATIGDITFQFGDGSTETTYPTWSTDTPGWEAPETAADGKFKRNQGWNKFKGF